MPTLYIKLFRLEQACFLESAGGTVVSSGDRYLLNGAFKIVICGISSDILEFSPVTKPAVVQSHNEGWILSSLSKTAFFFSATPLRIQAGLADPWIECRAGWIIQPEKSGTMAMISLDQVALSLIGNANNPGDEQLLYPSRLGPKKVALRKAPHPEDPTWLGYFLLPIKGGHAVHLGTISKNSITIDHAESADVILNDTGAINFVLPKVGSTLSYLSVEALRSESCALVRAQETTGLMMGAKSAAERWKPFRLPAQKIVVAGGWLQVKAFVPGETWIGHDCVGPIKVSEATSLFTHTSRLGWELSLPQSSTESPWKGIARLIYRDETLDNPSPAGRSERYYGLRVRGLGSRSGVPPALDVDLLTFNLEVEGKPGAKFQVMAGGKVSVGGHIESSRLVPKRQPHSVTAERILDIPVADELKLRCFAPPVPPTTALMIDTEKSSFSVVTSELLSAPAGISAKHLELGNGSGFAHWSLSSVGGGSVVFNLHQSGLKPQAGEQWLDSFRTRDQAKKYGLIEHPGTQLVIDGPISWLRGLPLTSADRKETQITTTTRKSPTGEELIGYAAFFATLSWLGVRCLKNQGVDRCLDEAQFKIAFPNLDDSSVDVYVKNNRLNDLRVVYFVPQSGDLGAVKGIHNFVDVNMRSDGQQLPEKFLWPFSGGLAVLLYERDVNTGKERYCDEIALERMRARPGIAFDLSAITKFDPSHMGWTQPEWERLAEESPMLWPRARASHDPTDPFLSGARLDPTDALWRGILLRDLPLFLPTPPIVGKEFEFLQNLIDAMNKRLILEYGWRDESGPTWVGGLDEPDPGILFSPLSWKDAFEMFLTRVRVKGAAGKVVDAEASCRVRLNFIKKKNSTDPIEIVGTFGLDLTSGGNPITRIDLTQDGDPIDTESIPGFRKVALRRIATDLKVAQVELQLIATSELAAALPFLSSNHPQIAKVTFNLVGEPTVTLSLALESEVETNLFGKWPLTVQAMSLGVLSDKTIELRVSGRLGLGLAALGTVGATVAVRRDPDGKLKFDVELHEIRGSLSIGSFQVEGGLKWADATGKTGSVDLGDVAKSGAERELWGFLKIQDPGILGTTILKFRVGNQGEVSFWIATIESSKSISVGIGELRNPALLFAHNADFEGQLSNTLLDPTGSVVAVLRPGPKEDIPTWLRKWKPSADIGSLMAGSGYLHLQDMVASAPVKDDKIDPTLLSSLIFTDKGLFRIDGVLAMLDAVTMRFGLAIDFEKKRITAGLQAPAFKLPGPDNVQYEIQAGYITIGLSFSGASPYFRVGIGWPERIRDSEFERDWSKATKVYIKSMVPINTFWGGYLAELQNNKVVFGFAIRAGWTWGDKVSIGGIVSGSAELGITLGGVFQFAIAWGNNAPFILPLQHPIRSTSSDLEALRISGLQLKKEHLAPYRDIIVAAMDSIEESNAAMANLDLILTAEIYGDIWGKASVEFLGVTIAAISVAAYARFKICGTLNSGITQAKSIVGFKVKVKILCLEYETEAQIDITFVDGECPLLLGASPVFVHEQPVFPLPALSVR